MAKNGWPQPYGSWRERIHTYITKKRKNTWDDDADLVIWTRGPSVVIGFWWYNVFLQLNLKNKTSIRFLFKVSLKRLASGKTCAKLPFRHLQMETRT